MIWYGAARAVVLALSLFHVSVAFSPSTTKSFKRATILYEKTPSVKEEILRNPNLSIFARLLAVLPELDQVTLCTVFAPTNSAFQRIDKNTFNRLVQPIVNPGRQENMPTLQKLMRCHVIMDYVASYDQIGDNVRKEGNDHSSLFSRLVLIVVIVFTGGEFVSNYVNMAGIPITIKPVRNGLCQCLALFSFP